jgi:predicted N-acetyltransferase YhbS
MSDLLFDIMHRTSGDVQAVEKLNERAFGPGRYARTAFRLREGVPSDADLNFVARVGTLLAGAVELTPVLVGGEPAVLLGPLVVDPVFEGKGLGQALIRHAHDAAKNKGYGVVLLVGDAPYYERSGYAVVPRGRLQMPGPVDPQRLLFCELVEGAFTRLHGPVRRDIAWADRLRDAS